MFRKQDQKKLFKAGVFLSFLCLVLMIMVISIGKQNSIFESKTILRARVNNVSNLQQGSYVDLRGIKIGTVEHIDIISESEVEIQMRVLTSKLKWIRKDAQIAISTAGLVGDKFLEIIPGSEGSEVIDPDKDILTVKKEEIFNELVSKGGSIASSTEKILSRLEAIVSSDKFEQFVASLHKTSNNLEKLTAELNQAQLGKVINSLNNSSGKLDRVVGRIEKGPGTLHSMIYDDSLHEDLRTLLGGAQRNKVLKYFIRQSIQESEKN